MAEKKIFPLTENCRLYPAEPTEQKLCSQWFVWYYIAGKRYQKKGNINSFTTVAERITAAKKIAQTIEMDLLVKKQKSIAYTPFVLGLQTALDNRSKSLRPKSVSGYKTKVSAFVKYLCNNLIENPTKQHVTDFFNSMKKQANTLAAYKVTLHGLIEDMKKEGVVYENIFSHIKIKKREMQLKWFFTEQQIQRIKTQMLQKEKVQLWLPSPMEYYAMLRPAEIRGIKIGDFLLEENKLLVRADISKNKKSEFVILPSKLIAVIEPHIKDKNDNDYFLSISGKQLGVNYLYVSFKKILTALNMDTQKHSFYSWKHTGARAWVKSGGSVYGLMRQMRHHSLDMTQLYLRKLGILEFEDDVNAMPII